MARLRFNQSTLIIFITQIAFAATDAVAGLKLIDAGMPKERLALLGVPMIPIQIILPLVISRYTGGSEPLKVFLKAYPFRYGDASYYGSHFILTIVAATDGETKRWEMIV